MIRRAEPWDLPYPNEVSTRGQARHIGGWHDKPVWTGYDVSLGVFKGCPGSQPVKQFDGTIDMLDVCDHGQAPGGSDIGGRLVRR
ncbi:MAG: hypothetical protein VX453_11915, partial [Acidobacteriota bacterium]|nr:hypothetical protein [Acidobacteriota bacterium]